MIRTTSIAGMLLGCFLSVHAEETKTNVASPVSEKSVSSEVSSDVFPQAWLEPKSTDSGSPLVSVVKTLGEDSGKTKSRPVVHLNNGGLDGAHGTTRGRSSAANRLRAIRDTNFLPNNPTRPKGSQPVAKSVQQPAESPTKAAPRTTIISDAPLNASNEIGAPRVPGLSSRRRSPATTTPPPTQKVVPAEKLKTLSAPALELPSVVTRRSIQDDAASVTETPNQPTLAAPQLAAPQLAAPQLAAPQLASEAVTPLAEEAPVRREVSVAQLPTATMTAPKAIPKVASLPSRPLPAATIAGNDLSPSDIATGQPSLNVPQDVIERPAAPEFSTNDGGQLESDRFNSEYDAPHGRTQLPDAPQGDADLNFEPATRPRFQVSRDADVETNVDSVPNTGFRRAQDESDFEAAADGSRLGDEGESVLLSNRSPLIVVNTRGPQSVRVGRPATYYLTATNAGDLGAEDVVVSLNVPGWAEVTSNQTSTGLVRVEPNTDGHNLMKWTIRDLKPKSHERLRVDLVPRTSRPIDLGVTWNFKPISSLTQIQVEEPKLQLSVVGPSDMEFGDTKLYTITVSNPGSGDAENVVLSLLPISDGRSGAKTKEIGTISAGARRTIEVELTARQAGELAVRATAMADGGLKSEGEQRVRVRRAALAIDAKGPKKKYSGTEANYAFKVTNTGDAIAPDVIVSVSLPMATKYVNSSGGGSYDANRGKVTWAIGALRPGAFQVVEMTSILSGEGPNRLEARTSGGEYLSAATSVATMVESLADLKLTVNDPKGAVAIGSEMTYEVVVTNRGTKAARNVNIVGYFSEGIEPVSVRGWRADVEVGQVVLEQIPRIAPGQEMVIRVVAQAMRAGDHVFRTELDSNDPETKLAVEEWTRFYGDSLPATESSGTAVKSGNGFRR